MPHRCWLLSCPPPGRNAQGWVRSHLLTEEPEVVGVAEVLPGVEDLEEGMESQDGHGVLRSPFPLPSPPTPVSALQARQKIPRSGRGAAAPRVCVWGADTGVPQRVPAQPATRSPALMPTSLRRNSLQGALV